jgi:hypothetical protein
MLNDQSRNRMNKLFTEIEQLVPQPNGNGSQPPPILPTPSSEIAGCNKPASLLQEVESLRARILELEAQRNEKETKPLAPVSMKRRRSVLPIRTIRSFPFAEKDRLSRIRQISSEPH